MVYAQPESVLKNEEKENLSNCGLCRHWVKLKESEKKDKNWRTEKTMKNESDGDTNCSMGAQ